jgi:preprotein translocase subunit SecD
MSGGIKKLVNTAVKGFSLGAVGDGGWALNTGADPAVKAAKQAAQQQEQQMRMQQQQAAQQAQQMAQQQQTTAERDRLAAQAKEQQSASNGPDRAEIELADGDTSSPRKKFRGQIGGAGKAPSIRV